LHTGPIGEDVLAETFLLSGRSGVGKTTALKEILAQLSCRAGGFFTEELREGRIRHGYRIVTLDGQDALLADVGILSTARVSRYGVDIYRLEQVGVRALELALTQSDLVVIDEIGKMELLSGRFRAVVERAVDSELPVLGTVMLAAEPWLDTLKARPRVHTWVLSGANRRRVKDEVVARLRRSLQRRSREEHQEGARGEHGAVAAKRVSGSVTV
jgi:nucleoside-triphosphatase